MKWKDIWQEEPPRYEEIYFKLGNGSSHIGMCQGFEKLRKCEFCDLSTNICYDCDTHTPINERVIEWCPWEEDLGKNI